jgi:hypothetical protein
MRKWTGLTIALGAGLLAPGLKAQDKAITTRDGSCEVAVPADWVAGFPGSANSADKKVEIVMSTPRSSSFAALKENAKKLYAGDKVTRDTASEFQMEGQSLNNKPNVYRAITSGGKICLAEVIYESGTADDARKIVGTMKMK